MAIPDVTVTVQDGALGLNPADTSGIPLLIGVCSSGAADTIYSFSDQKTLTDTLGTGPLVDAAATYLATAGGPVYCVRITPTTAGAAGAVTHVGTGLSALTVGGTINDQFDVVVTMVVGGANPAAGVATFKVSLDGGDNTSAVIAVPTGGTYTFPAGSPAVGMTLTWSAATLVAGDTYSFSTTAGSNVLSDFQATLTAVLADPRTWGFVHIIGLASSVSVAAALAAGIETTMESAAAAFRYAFALIGCPDDTDANIIAGFASVSAKRIMVAAGFAEMTSPVSGLIRKRTAALAIGARCALVPIHEDLGRVKTGPIIGAVSLDRDEQATPGLDAQRFATLRTIIGRQGFWVTSGNLMSPSGSDFKLVQHRRVMDLACSVVRDGLLEFLNDTVRVQSDTDPTPGAIFEVDARAIEAFVKGKLDAALVSPGHASSTQVIVDRTADILSTETLPVTVRVVPLGYARAITVNIGFTNPALTLKVA